jgi:photosynthetic reaction center cytochrome c subunit
MQAFRGALGVQCTHCHVQGDFSSDENPKKETTRQMIALVKDINAKLPQGKGVSCYTCHRGAVEPLRAIPQPPPPPPPPPQQN